MQLSGEVGVGSPAWNRKGQNACHLPLAMQALHLEVEREIVWGATENMEKKNTGLMRREESSEGQQIP